MSRIQIQPYEPTDLALYLARIAVFQHLTNSFTDILELDKVEFHK